MVMDNFFTSILLFRDLERKGIYATSTIRSNRIAIRLHLKNTKTWKRSEQGHLEWAMHGSRGLSCVMWKDKCPLLLISTHALRVGFPCMPMDTIIQNNGAVREVVPNSPMILEYTTFIKDVDVADQLQALYSSQSRSNKWWYGILWALLDITEVISILCTCMHAGEEKINSSIQ